MDAKPLALAAAILLIAWSPVRADTVVFDNATSLQALTSGNGNSWTAIFQSNINQTINGIGAQVDALQAGDIKFALFDLGNGAGPTWTGPQIFATRGKYFAADDATSMYEYKISDPFSFTLAPGEWYAVGAISNSGMAFFFDDAKSFLPNFPAPGPTFTGYANKENNIAGYDDPQIVNASGFWDGNFHYRLYVNDAVPELSTWAMMILGFCSLGFMAYRKNKIGLAAILSSRQVI